MTAIRRPAAPRLLHTAPGRLGVGTIVALCGLYALVPILHEALVTTAVLLVAMLPATAAGSCLRIATDIATGQRVVGRDSARQRLLLAAIAGVVALQVLHAGYAMAALADDPLDSLMVGMAAVTASAMTLAALGAGYLHGDDATWRREHGLD